LDVELDVELELCVEFEELEVEELCWLLEVEFW